MESIAKWFVTSKTLWLNLLGPVFVFLGAHYAITVDAETQTMIVGAVMALANIAVRIIFTTQPVTLAKP